MQTKVYYIFLVHSPWKETAHEPSNVAAATNLFCSVHVIGIIYFDQYFLFYAIKDIL